MGWAVAAPIIASAAGSAISSHGAKKAAGKSGPQIPQIFAGPLTYLSRYLGQGIRNGGLPQYGGPFTAPMNPFQQQGLNFAGQTLGAGDNGLQAAFRTVTGAAESGFNPADLQLAKDYLQPYYDYQKQQGLAQVREGEAQGGRFYGSGGLNAEGNFLQGLSAQQSQELLPLAVQMANYRLGAAQSVPGFLGQQMALGQGLFGLGEQARGIQQGDINARLQEWLRTRPEGIASILASVMGGTPFFNPTVAPNAGMLFGQGLSGLGSSPDFLRLIQAWQTSRSAGGGGNLGGTPSDNPSS